jgi:hypothetical protein
MEEEQNRDTVYARLIDQFDPGMGKQLAGLQTRGDERALGEGAAILATAAPLVAHLDELRPEVLTLHEVLDQSEAQQRAALHALTAIVEARQFVDGLSIAQAAAEPKAAAVSRALHEKRRHEAEEGIRRAAERKADAQRKLVQHRQTLAALRREREALDAQDAAADEAEERLRVIDRELLDWKIGFEETLLRGAELDLSSGDVLAGFHTAGAQLADLFHVGYLGITHDHAKARRAAEGRRRRSRWLRRLRYVAYGILGLVVGQVLAPASAGWGFVVAVLLWLADQYFLEPRLVHWEADKRSTELQHEVIITTRLWLRLRSFQGALQLDARTLGVDWAPFVPMPLFVAGAKAVGFPVGPEAPPDGDQGTAGHEARI